MFRLVYTIIFTLCMPFVFLKLLWRGYNSPEYRDRKLERFGFFKAPTIKNSIWVHAVSVGEVLAAEPIIREIQKRYPSKYVVLTSMTPTSSALIRKLFGNSVFHVYAPYDLPWLVDSFLRRVKPEFLIIMETELWPNTIHRTRLRGCPVVLANARLSERSARGYRRLKPAVGWMLNELYLVICQHQNDAKRFASLGIDESKISVTGSVKYDLDIAETHLIKGAEQKRAIGDDQIVWIAASTHEGEDARLLKIHREIRKVFPDVILILVPRHPERFEGVYQLALNQKFKAYRRSECEFIPADSEVFVVDSMGELLDFYVASDIAFIGGSLVEVGGHNPIEPGALGLPIIMGPYVFNFEAICQQLVSVGGLYLAEDDESLQTCLLSLMRDVEKAQAMGHAALGEIEASKGAVIRVVDALTPLLDQAHQVREL
jgi:3-deoxy-D-manno-octulosonic-acid transferase